LSLPYSPLLEQRPRVPVLPSSYPDNKRDKFVSARHKGVRKKRHDPMIAEHVVKAFTEEQVSRLTGISRNQLRHWIAPASSVRASAMRTAVSRTVGPSRIAMWSL
jgi:hypothetical protein